MKGKEGRAHGRALGKSIHETLFQCSLEAEIAAQDFNLSSFRSFCFNFASPWSIALVVPQGHSGNHRLNIPFLICRYPS